MSLRLIVNCIMKRFSLVIMYFLSFTFASAQGYRISIEVEGITDSVLYLGYHFGNQKFLKDTSNISNSKAIFEGEEKLQPGVYFAYNPSTYFEFLVSEQKFSLKTKGPDYLANMQITGSKENEVFKRFHTYMRESQEKINELNTQFETAATRDDSVDIQEKLRTVSEDTEAFRQKIIQDNKTSYVGKILTAMQKTDVPEEVGSSLDEKEKRRAQYNYYKEHFFDHIDFNSEDLLRTPVLHPKIDEYMERVIAQHPDSIKLEAERLINKSADNPAFFRYLLVTLTSKYEQSNRMGMDAVFVHLAEKFYLTGKADWISDETKKKFLERVTELKPNLIGKYAPSLSLIDTLNKSVRLNDVDSRYTVLYFYSPTCGHCKKKTPVLHSEYPQLKELGAEVLCVNIDTDTKEWKKFIKEKKLSGWLNLGDPNVRSNFRRDYNIKSTPTIYILDEQKKIIAKKIGVEQIKEILEIEERIRKSES